MASTDLGRRLTEAHRLAQTELAARSMADMAATWTLLDPGRIDATVNVWLEKSAQVVSTWRDGSTQTAIGYSQAFRAAEVPSVIDGFRPLAGDPLDPQSLASSLLSQGPWKLKSLTGAGWSLGQASVAAQVAAAAAGARVVLAGGRSSIINTANADPKAFGARRVTAPGCCSFCALLALRSIDGLSAAYFKAHDNCMCQPETAYRDGERDATRQAKEFNALYRETIEINGQKNIHKTFRRALNEQRRSK